MLGKTYSIRWLSWFACYGLIALACFCWSLFPSLEAEPIFRVVLFFVSGVAMLGMVFIFPVMKDRSAWWLIVGSGVLLRVLLWPSPVSDDVNRYLWEGQLVHDGGNPYVAPANDPRWEDRRDATWQAMNHRDRATAYPPGIQWIMAGATAISPTLGIFKILAVLGDIITLLLLLGLLRYHAVPLRWAGFYAFNPVVLIAFAGEAHFDSLMIAALLAAVCSATRRKTSAWLWLGLAIQIKLVCVVLVPLFLTRRSLSGIWLFGLVMVVPSLPFLYGLVEWVNGVRNFASSGDFNAPLYTLLVCLGIDSEIVRIISNGVFAVGALSIYLARWRGMGLVDACMWILGMLLVCSPIVHFWYVAWLLPFVCLRPSFAWVTVSITMAGYFIAWWTLENAGWWGFGHGVAGIIWTPWMVALFAQHRSFVARLRVARAMAEEFRVCVVIPVLNAGPEVEKLVRQLRGELGFSEEIVVVHAGEALTTPDGVNRMIESKRGRGNQIAAGIAATQAPWIMVVHADSIPRVGWLDDLRDSIENHPDASLLVFGQRFDRSGAGTLLLEVLNEMRVVFGGVAFGDQTMVIRRSAMDAAGGFPAQPLMEDVEASLRLAGQGKVIYLGKEWTLSARKWGKDFFKRFVMIVRLIAMYQFARWKGMRHAGAVSERMYLEYYPDVAERNVGQE